MKSKKLYVWGWWQGKNLGDNWIKRTLSNIFPEANFIDTRVQEFEKNSFVICGGGGLFIYDVIKPWDDIQKDIEYGMIGLGAEFPHEGLKAVELYNDSSFFYVRDQYSLDCMHLSNIERSYDITFAIPLKWTEPSEQNKDKLFMVWRDGHKLVNNQKFREYIVPDEKRDSFEIWETAAKKHFSEIIQDDFQTRDDNIEERIQNCGFVISGRYHGIVAAIQKGLPFIAIDICPKIRALLEECGLDEYCIKISETDKIEPLIVKAQDNLEEIRRKEAEFIRIANGTLTKQIKTARSEIRKALGPLSMFNRKNRSK